MPGRYLRRDAVSNALQASLDQGGCLMRDGAVASYASTTMQPRTVRAPTAAAPLSPGGKARTSRSGT
jgi:hypothetical protein